MTIRSTEVAGELGETTKVRLSISDHPDRDQSKEWIDALVVVPVQVAERFGTLQITVLRRAQMLIDAEINRLEVLRYGQMR